MVLLHTQQTVKYFRVAPAAVWAFDYCLTFEHEVRLFSSVGRWNIATVLFIIARYSPIIWLVSDIYVTLKPQSVEMCLTSYRVAGSAMFLILASTEGLLLIRTLALWHDNRKIKSILLISYLLVVCLLVICIILVSSLLNSVCVPISTPSSISEATKVERLIMAEFVGSALFELMAIIVTLYHSIQHSGARTITLASTLRKGTFLYALSLLAISVANIATLSLPISSGKNGILDVFQGALHGVLASRILFDLRAQAHAVDWNEEHSSDLGFVSYGFPSRLRFASRTIR